MTDVVDHTHQRRFSRRVTYALTGFLLGLGAPSGAFLLRLLTIASVRVSLIAEIESNLFFYTYTLVGTCTVFALAGWVAGHRADRLQQLEAFYHDRSEIDLLTGLLNAGAFRDRYDRMIARAKRYGTPVALLLIDIDRLKEINDRHGHQRGNSALRRLADALRASKRAADVAARWGGDEFVMLLDDADLAAATRVAGSVVERLRAEPLSMRGQVIELTITVGVTAGIPIGRNDDLFEAADRALYRGKQEGRNRVIAAGLDS